MLLYYLNKRQRFQIPVCHGHKFSGRVSHEYTINNTPFIGLGVMQYLRWSDTTL